MSNEINELLATLSPEEYKATMKILNEVSDNGTSNTLVELYNEDFIETPVDIDTFIESSEYAGWFTNNGVGIYPYWRERLREIFNSYDEPSEICLSGSIGSGKSHIAVLGLAYAFYWLMCLKDPYKYFGLAKGSNIYIVFFNATLTLSQGVAYTKFQSLLQNSPWFMRHGKLSGVKNVEYVPDGPIAFSTGSQMEHSIGRDIFLAILDEVNFCVSGDTKIITEDGIKEISELSGQYIRVFSKSDNGDIVLSNKTLIAQTGLANKIYNIELEDGTIIKCTGNHLFRLKSGEYKRADSLTTLDEIDDVDTSLMVNN